MTDYRKSSYANQVQTDFRDSFEMAPTAPTLLRAMAMELQINPGGNTFREFITPLVRGTSSTMDTIRARTSNLNPLTTDLTHGGQITSTVERIGYLDHEIQDSFEWARDLEMTAGVDALYNQPDRVAARLREQFDDAYRIWSHEKCLAQAIYSNEWITEGSDGATGAAITAGATTFEVTNAYAATLTVGDLLKIGDRRRPNDGTNGVETIDVITIKTIGADDSGGSGAGYTLITIETDTADFPASDSSDGDGKQGNGFEKLKVALSAHGAGTRVQADIPWSLSVNNVDKVLSKIKTQALRTNQASGELMLYMTPEVDEILYGTNTSGVRTSMVANDFLGKQILFNGNLEKYRGMNIMSDANALSRVEAYSGTDLTTQRHYIWAFVKGQTFGFGEPLKGNGTLEDIVGTDQKLKKFSFLEVAGAVTLYAGSLKGFLVPVTVS